MMRSLVARPLRAVPVTFTVALLLLAAAIARPAGADVVDDWNQAALDAIRAGKTAPPLAARNLAIAQAAVYDAVNGIDRTHAVYRVDLPVPAGGASYEAAVAAAAHRALSNLFPASQAQFDALLTTSLAAVPNSAAKTNGVAYGQSVADGMLALRANDGASTTVAYTPSPDPGKWRPTPPANAPALLPQWPNVTPFCMTSGSQFRKAGPPALTSAAYLTAYDEVRRLGSKTSTERTADQTAIALFWADGGGTETPPGHWNAIARDVAAARGTTAIPDKARMLAMLDVALADAGIAAWDMKFQQEFWRPVTAIREAATVPGFAGVADPAWEPLLVTPPFPEYVSGHSTFSGAAATVLAGFFGSDGLAFTTDSDDVPGASRSYASFSQAADEAGRSRIYGGIHYEFSNQDGLATGRQIGGLVMHDLFAAVPEPSGGLLLAGAAAARLAGRRRR